MRPGYKQTEVGVIPEDWDAKALRDDVNLLSGYHVLAKYCNFQQGTPYITGPADFQNGAIKHTKFTTLPASICKTGDILVTVKGSGVGTLVIADAAYCISRQLMAVTANSWDSSFVYYSILRNASSATSASTGLIPGLSRDDILDIQLPVPRSANEQRAIAEALADADAAVAGLERLIAKKRDLKQAAMQQLLTGQTRLPGFSGAWEVKRLGDLAHLYQPETIGQSSFSATGYPVYGANGVVGYFDRFNHLDPQLMVSCRGNCGTVNRSQGPAWITGNAMVINLNGRDHKGHFEYMYHLLAATNFSLVTTGSGQPQIVREPLRDLELKLPADLVEQTAIATVLSDMDAELAALQAQLDKTRLIKQAMMQDLLTGRVRLPFQ